MMEIRVAGPVRGNWPHYSKLSDREHHCHVRRGKPTYVVVWCEMENGKRPIGKETAKKLAKALNIDYRVFL